MKKILKNDLKTFINYYHYFHDSYITNINYDISNSKIELIIDVCWSGTPVLNNDKTYNTNKTKIKISFINIEKINIKEISSWEYINNAYLEYITLDEKEYICFADNKETPLIYIISKKIEYEELR